MDVQFADIKVVSMSGYKPQWKIMPEDITMVDDMQFVKLKATSGGLQSLLFEGNELAQSTPKIKMVTSSVGMAHMMKLRDTAVKDTAQQQVPSTSCLFNEPVQPKTIKRSRIEVQQKRASEPRSSLEISITVDGLSHPISVMEPVASRDAMHVLCTEETLAIVIKFIRDEGFTEPDQRAKTSGLPPGIYTRGSKFLAVKFVEGSRKHKVVADAESGVAWQMSTDPDGDDTDDEDAEFTQDATYAIE